MRINHIIKNSKVNGPETRYTIWVQGCSIKCLGCSNTDTWEFNSGEEISIEKLTQDIFETNPKGITLTGGEPLDQIESIIKLLKNIFPHFNILLTSGYTLNQIKNSTKKIILDYVDILISGPFKRELPDITNKWRGSSNQKINFLTKRGKLFEYYQSEFGTEIRINKKNHDIVIDGFALNNKIIQKLIKEKKYGK